MKLTIYQGISTSLESGIAVPQAAFDNYYLYAHGKVDSTPVNYEITNADWQVIYQDMITVLTDL